MNESIIQNIRAFKITGIMIITMTNCNLGLSLIGLIIYLPIYKRGLSKIIMNRSTIDFITMQISSQIHS